MKDIKHYLGIRYFMGYYKCNLKCPYCIASYDREQKLPFDLDKFINIINKIKKLPYSVCLRIGTGGEFFTSPEILGVIRDICNEENNIFGVSFSSNIYADWEKVIKPFVESVNTSKLGMGCTLHDTVIKDVDPFFEKVKHLKESGILLYVGHVALPQRIDLIKQYKQRCQDIGVPLLLNALIGKVGGAEGYDPDLTYPRDYTAGELKRLKRLWGTPHGYKLLVEACSTRGMSCSAGKNYIFIDSDGNVFPCSAIKSSMGNILNGNVSFQENDTTCPVSTCWCGNENQALRIVDKYYDRTRTLRLFYPKENMPEKTLYKGYNPSIYPGWQFRRFVSALANVFISEYFKKAIWVIENEGVKVFLKKLLRKAKKVAVK